MAKRRTTAHTRAQSMFRVVGESAGAALGSAFSGMFANIRHETNLFMDDVEDRAMEFRSRFMKRMFASLLIGIGALFLFVAVLMYLVDLFNLRWATAMLIVGIIILATAFIIQGTAVRKRGRY
jgi:hypothetical protein